MIANHVRLSIGLEKKVFKAIVLIWIVGVEVPTILEDELGPYNTVEKCFHRGAVIIKAAVTNVHYSVAKAETICFEKKLEGLDT